ncbi:manganese efflux pump MntP [Inconstantimicrobium porci]|uniref:manganese efflux pump MntP n=1 Tax=Inconstantimicrobium porci TaxID=2652291 RepID=UPI0030C699B6
MYVNFITILLTAVGLSMDAFAVSLTIGLDVDKDKQKKAALMSGVYFGGFQALMPVIGYLLGVKFTKYIESVDHWIAFVLLAVIGVNMIREALSGDNDKEEMPADYLNHKKFVMLAIATSIDALAVGVSFAFLSVNIISSAVTIGITTFLFSVAAVVIGKKIGDIIKNKAEILGGVILIIIGIKILLEHIIK